jgi:hypothetical protein
VVAAAQQPPGPGFWETLNDRAASRLPLIGLVGLIGLLMFGWIFWATRRPYN